MSNSYHFKELIDQNTESEVYRVIAEDGAESILTRLKFSPEVLAGLFGEGIFEKALGKLKSLRFDGLGEVTDGGMNEDDGSTWVTSPLVKGKVLSEQKLEEEDIRSLGMQCQNLMKDMGELAGAVSFDPTQIQTVRAPDGVLRALFSINYFRWFRDAAAGHPYGSGQNEAREVRKLLEDLVIQQLKIPEKRKEKIPIPFVEDRSPALGVYEPPRSQNFMGVLLWLGLFLALGVIAWSTVVGMKRMEENPRKEMEVWQGR